jgi:hypothetical protein
MTEVKLIIHLLKYLKNSSDLESKTFLQYLAQNSQDKLPIHDFAAAWRYFRKLISKIDEF